MVMHARKLPRIDDGYPDKREAQSYQSSQYPSKTGYSNHNDRYERRRSPGRDSPSSRDSPRYINKSSYIERNKERYERGNENSPGKKANHNYAGGSSNSNSGNHDKQSAKSAANAKDKTEVQKSAIRTCGDWSEHLSSTGKKYYYNIKKEVSQWERPREWNDSSAVRPDRHCSEPRANSEKHNSKDVKNRHSSGGIEKREKHLGDLRHMVADGNPKPDKMYLFEKLQQSQSKLQAEMRANKQLYSSDSKESHRRNDDGSTNDYPNSTNSSRSRRDSEGTRMLARQTSRNDQDDIDSPSSTPTSHRSGSTPYGCINPVSNISTANLNISNIPNLITQLSGGQNNQELTNRALQTLQKLQQALSRQIAAHQTSVSNQSSQSTTVQESPRHQVTQLQEETIVSYQQQLQHHHQLQQQAQQSLHATLLAPGTPSHTAHRSPYINSQNSVHLPCSSPQPIVSLATNVSPVATTTGSTSIPITHTGNQVHRGNTVYGKFLGSQNQSSAPSFQQSMEDMVGENSKGIEGGGSSERSCCSPTPSDTSSQGAPVDPDMFSSANLGQKETNLMSSLSQYYNEHLVSHVTGWQGDQFEKQARFYREEALRIGSLISSQVSVELKRARSLVRVEEIQATLHEQRNLFLAQQITELENMKPVSSVSSFLPSSSASNS